MIPETGIFKYAVEALIGLGIAIITYFVTKKKMQDAQVGRVEVDTKLASSDIIIKNLDIYQKMLDDIEQRYEEKLSKRDEEIKNLEKAVEQMRERIKQLEEECIKKH